MAYWAGEYNEAQYQKLSISGEVITLSPAGGSITLPTGLTVSGDVGQQLSTIQATITALDAYARAINEALDIQGASYP